MARVNGTLTGTSFARGGEFGASLLVLGGQPAADAITSGGTAYSLTASPATFTITGAAAGPVVARRLTASAGSVAVTGDAATFAVHRIISAAAASYAVTGDPATLIVARILAATAAAYSISGSQAALAVARVLTAAPAGYTIAGDGATLVYNPSTVHTFNADAGSFAISGQDATLVGPARKGGGQHGAGRVVEVDTRELILRNDDEIAALLAALL